MKRVCPARALAFALILLAPLTAFATAQRTFVAAYGNDASPCSLAQPCRSFAAAVANTSANGEVIVLDSAGYGPVTITQSVSIIAPAGVYAGVSVFSSAPGVGITVDGSGIKVVLRGLSINGQGGGVGIRFAQGAVLTVEDCEISNMFTAGIIVEAANSESTVTNSVVRNNSTGIVVPVAPAGSIRVMASGNLIADNEIGVYAFALTGSATQVTLTRSTVTNSAVFAFSVSAFAGGSASILSDGNTVTYAPVAFDFHVSGGSEAIFTAGNNAVGYVTNLVLGGVLTTCCGM